MGNLHGKLKKEYVSFTGFVKPSCSMLTLKNNDGGRDVIIEFSVLGTLSEEKLKRVFDDFYGGRFERVLDDFQGKVFDRSYEYVLSDIPIRMLFFETSRYKKLLAIGHVQEDTWISILHDDIVTESVVVDDYIKQYIKNMMHDFPHFVDKFMHIFKNNPFEICDYLNLQETDPLDTAEIFKQAYIKIAQMQE